MKIDKKEFNWKNFKKKLKYILWLIKSDRWLININDNE